MGKLVKVIIGIILLVFLLTPPLYSLDFNVFEGIWIVETTEAIQIIQLYTDGFDHFTNGYIIRDDFTNDPLSYTQFNFIDEDLLYITRADGSKLRGFYQIKENSGINNQDFPYYIYLEDKYANNYYFPLRKIDDNLYEINYHLELGLKDILIQISCIAIISREKD